MRLNAIVAALTILLFSPAVLALSLGEAKSHSHLNQPLKASIVVRAVKYDERDTIRAIIPDAEKFSRAGVRRDAIVENMRIDVSDGAAEDELLIHITTDKRIKEPFVNFLVEVRWLGGSVTREYTLLLDPSPVAAARQGSDDVSTQPMTDSESADVNSFTDQTDDMPASYGSTGSRQYGPVKRHETLWSIAFSQRRDPSISMDQMQLAIYRANPQAFDGNINQMRTGSMLTIPSDAEIRRISESEAKSEVSKQKRSYQPPPPAYSAPAPAPEPIVEPEPEPIVEVEPVIEPEPEMPAESVEADQQVTQVTADEESASTESEPPPAMASASATAEGDALTEDELVAEGDTAEASSGDIEMPSVWVDEESEQTATAQPQEPTVQNDQEVEAVVDVAPPESGFDLGELTDVVSPVTLLLAVVLILVLLLTYWWYRKRSVQNVGTQFAHATDDEGDNESAEPPAEKKSDESVGTNSSPSSVWSDQGGLPDSIDEYAASTPGADELDLDDSPEAMTSAPIVEATAIELDSDDTSPIREMSGEEIDYLGEADVHLAYGLYDEAASVLQRGIDENPNRSDLRLKLLEVFHSGGMSEEFVVAAEAWKQSGLVDDNEWNKVIEMGQEVAPQSTLFGTGQPAATQNNDDTGFVASVEETPAAEAAITIDDDEGVSGEKVSSETESGGDDSLDFDLSGFDLDASPEPEGETAEPEPQEAEKDEADSGLDFDTADLGLDNEATDTGTDVVVEPVESESESLADLASAGDESTDDESFDIDLGELSLSEDAAEADLAHDPDFDAPEPEDGIDALTPADSMEFSAEDVDDQDSVTPNTENEEASQLDIDQLDDTPIADDPAIDTPASEGDEEEVSVKLDLARAYMDMGEPEMARALLDEVVEMGNEQQKQEAQDLISRA